MFPIDAELDALLGLELPDCTEVPPDAIDKFLAEGALAAKLAEGGIGPAMGHARVEKFAEEIAGIDQRAARILKRDRTAPAAAAANDWDMILTTDDSRVLAKMETASHRRKIGLRQWISSQLALNISIPELVKHAQRHDPATARLIAEIGQELELEAA